MIIEQTDRENISLQLRGQVLAEMEHAYLNDWIGLPDPESFQLITSSAILQAASCSNEDTRLISTVLMLVHHGLTIHEQVDESRSYEEKIRQLQVLAGDYYSSKYFYLLATVGKIELIGLFAEAIALINETKAELTARRGTGLNIDTYLSLNERIYGELLLLLASYYHHDQPIMKDTIRLLVRTHILGMEYRQFAAGRYTDNLAHLYLLSRANEEERKYLSSNAGIMESRVIALHVKYGTSGYLADHLHRGLAAAKSLVAVYGSKTVEETMGRVFSYLNDAYLNPGQIAEER